MGCVTPAGGDPGEERLLLSAPQERWALFLPKSRDPVSGELLSETDFNQTQLERESVCVCVCVCVCVTGRGKDRGEKEKKVTISSTFHSAFFF